MRFFSVLVVALFPLTLFATGMQGMSEADMKAMMQKMQDSAACMQKVDQKELDKLKQQTEKLEKDIKSLCSSGKRKAAQQKANDYSKKMLKNPAMKQLRQCQAPMKGMLAYSTSSGSNKPQHVCDVIK